MSAPVAFGLIYERIMRHRDDVDRARVDMILGMPGAQSRYDDLLTSTLTDAGIEVR